MEITFDPDKDAANLAKHALSLSLARDLEWDTLQWKEDTQPGATTARPAWLAMLLWGNVFMASCMSFVVMCTELSACARPISER